MTSRNPALDPIVEQAIEWWVALHSGETSDAEREAAASWRHEDPRHMEAWQRISHSMERKFAPVQALGAPSSASARAARRALLRSPGNRRAFIVKGSLAVAGLGTGGLILANRVAPLRGLTADLRAATGQRRSFDLGMGSHVLLNARSSADYVHARQEIHLRDGELIAESGPDPQTPLKVRCDHGRVSATTAGGRFLVQQTDDRSLAVALRHGLLVETAGDTRILPEGHGAWFDRGGFQATEGNASDRAAWSQGLLVVRDEALGTVVKALRKYRRGVIRISTAAARLRVLGVYPLDDSDRALASLGETLPIQVRRIGAFLTLIDLR